jgi:hypothetical protein
LETVKLRVSVTGAVVVKLKLNPVLVPAVDEADPKSVSRPSAAALRLQRHFDRYSWSFH